MSASNKKRKLPPSGDDSGAAPAATTGSSRKKASAAGGSASAPENPAFSLKSVQAGARAATAAALAGATAADVDSALADAKVHFLTSDKASWVLHVPRWYRRIRDARAGSSAASEAAWFEELWSLHPDHHDEIVMFGRAVPTPRFQQAYGESYRFSGNTFTALPVPEPLRACVQTMQAVVPDAQRALQPRSFLRGALVNWYASGAHYIGPHSDGEASLLRHSPVLSLSLGAARRFVFTAKRNTPEEKDAVQRLELLLQDGDLVAMGGTTQLTHKHALPKMQRCLERRVSVTMRCFK